MNETEGKRASPPTSNPVSSSSFGSRSTSASSDSSPSVSLSTATAESSTSSLPSSSSTSSSSRPASSASSSSPVSPSRSSSPTSASSRIWSSWISPSSSASAAASSALEEDHRRKRRPSFEEFRAEEPPQARLIRLRGLFDVLLDKDEESALAGGRAKEEWTRSAMRARYGAGGAYARGSLAVKKGEYANWTNDTQFAPRQPARLNTEGSSSSSSSSSKQASLPVPPRQSYAKELLTQCRECRAQLEKERILAEKGGSSSWTHWIPFTSHESSKKVTEGVDSIKGKIDTMVDKVKPSRPAEEESWSWSSPFSAVSHLFSSNGKDEASKSAELALAELHSDHEGEAGWIGSGVWGLSAVGQKQRQADRERDHKVAGGHEVEDDGGRRQRQIEWEGFLRYAEQKERELYNIFTELDKNCDMKLDIDEIHVALDRAGIDLPQPALEDFITSLGSSTRQQGSVCPKSISFPQFRDYLLLLPRKPSVSEIFRFYQVRKAFGLFGSQGIFAEFSESWGRGERHGATAVNPDGDVSLTVEERKKVGDDERGAKREARRAERSAAAATSGEDSFSSTSSSSTSTTPTQDFPPKDRIKQEEEKEEEEEEEEDNDMIHGMLAVKFLLAGGIAGAVSRTATAPFDRLKIYLITTARTTAAGNALTHGVGAKNSVDATAKMAASGMGLLKEAIWTLYREGGGLKAFWIGNGLNCVKIFPESAIKFLSYEMSKRAFAKYVDGVSDSRDISGASRFMSGGIGGITSQLAIYPVETLKTRLMSSQGGTTTGNALLIATAKDMWKAGGMRTYYRGLTAGLIGVFPYSAIDMSTFEGIKLFWIRYTGREEPSVLSLLAFGSISGSVGATTVYPLNLIRTRLQAAGTPAHPQTYLGFWDAARKTYRSEGVVGFYRGLVPTLAKVVPAVSISYVVYEHSKRHLGVQ